MKYCARCLYPENHPLNITFDDEGVCSGCRVHEEKDEIDWTEKEQELEQILSQYRRRPGASYDCVIPVNGNGDSYWVVDTIKNKYKLNPLLVTYNIQFNTKIGIRNMANLLAKLDCDHMSYTVDPAIAKKVTRIAIHRMGDMYWHVLAGTQAFPVQVATKMKIPLIVWGVHGWLDQVGMFSHHDAVEMTKKVWKEHSLRSHAAEQMVDAKEGVDLRDLNPFLYPSDREIEEARVRGIFLGNFVRWDAQAQTEEMIRKYGYETTEEERTFNRYETIYCHHNAGLHDYLKYLKYGFGKATDHASRDIRLNRLTREQGIELVKTYESRKPSDLKLFLEWVGMSESEFFAQVDRFRDPGIWEKRADGSWSLKDSVANHAKDPEVEAARLPIKDARPYVQTPNKEKPEDDDQYVLLGRTYSDETNFKAIEG